MVNHTTISKAGDLSDFLYLKGSRHRDRKDSLLYIAHIVKIDSNNNNIGIRIIINSNGAELGNALHNNPIMLRDIEEMITKYETLLSHQYMKICDTL